MSNPTLSIIIPTHNRPHLLPYAVKSALEQTMDDLEVIVVDDGSSQALDLPCDRRVRSIRIPKSRGGATARNVGTEAACSRWVTYLDDDDRLLPHMAKVSLEALNEASLPAPVAVISGLEVINPQGQVIKKRLPPPDLPRGSHFSLEEIEAGYCYNTKQTLVVERDVIQKIGGWDETFRSRVHTELFLRLNPECSILGLPIVTYQLYAHQEERVSRNANLRQESFEKLVCKHEALFKAHPKMFANFVYKNALSSYKIGENRTAFFNFLWAMQLDIFHIFPKLTYLSYLRFIKQLPVENLPSE